MVQSLRRLWPATVRARWLLTTAVLGVSTAILAVTGLVALRSTHQIVASFDEKLLPSVAKSLELAERVSHLAATAPYVAEVAIMSKLTQESAELDERRAEVARLAGELPIAREAPSGLPPLLAELQQILDDLIATKRRELFVREDLRARLLSLEQLRSVPEPRRPADVDAQFALVTRLLQLAAVARSPQALQELQTEHRARMQRHLPVVRKDPAVAEALDEAAVSIVALRTTQMELEERRTFLLARTRVLSDQLTASINRHVRDIQRDVSARKETLSLVVRSGVTGVLLVSALTLGMLIAAVTVARRSLRRLAAVTDAMSTLARGGNHERTLEPAQPDEIGALIAAFEVFRDNALSISRMSHSMSAQTRLLETVFNNINDGLSVFDRRSRLRAWNPRYAKLLGLQEEQLREGMHIAEVQALLPEATVVAGTGDQAPGTIGSFNDKRRLQERVLEVVFTTGRVLSVRSQPMPDGGFVTLYADLTERRAIDLQLRQSQKMEVLGQLTGGIAHDFNNLLAAIMSNLQLLETDASLSPAPAKVVERALKAAERGASLTRRMLAFARKQPLYPERVIVDDMMVGMKDLIEYSAGDSVALSFDLDGQGGAVFIDRGQLENVLLNLTLNAVAAMPRGGRLGFSTRLLPADADAHDGPPAPHGGSIEITVSDTGDGMPPHVLERIFEPFFTTKKSEGSGLGLSIVYGFVKQSGGDIRVDSQVGHGTSFRIVLPTRTWASPVAPPSDAALPEVPSGLRVLLVEDDEDVRLAMVEVLQRLECEVFVAASKPAALRALDAHDIDLVLSDVGLSLEGDGLALRADVERTRPGVPVVMMSGLPADLLAQRYHVPPQVEILRKPFSIAALRQALAAAVLG
jgi:PAS domain S-box-containing protein